ncbi:MarR family transcriptional regulator [Rhodobacter sphaeroides]|jgi:transcriptional regulator, MarR family|uniref:Transcriptional regulator, MarR family n=1 Tax=Cereibacter sphaeroides (strain ATCC 17023 / DSM 158 / JCM 6121 / CCUG 31486 / LMG 2827 / NBRC 12203 / NCIMB 8253 / ATH 2.4.1.) TaxID=272943 RepID=Q3IXL0_CERS4|nr:MarR family transcriptional regulator [Cereibacter sphaeroides]ABN78918.1 transcriptional regulator, MarR family [Cereibacter sphaeroides ATCC 17029]ABA80724.1 transcriptional regulator, MarR family [Cereibacter sphaeroides 2.4.1]AMJ49053.1 MarR family transcriptional regulator [Cereibacter sphaeroides]ANS35769.1 MarR family transcriptional regulator [Cereibacter sphaeroides]ATN64822.1 MarR family transcriptional regulator [Cereibacter sphaeroides]
MHLMSKEPAAPFSMTPLIRDRCLCLGAQRAARTLARHFDEAFRPFGLRSGQFSLLVALNRPEPPAMAEVAEVLAVDRTTLTAALKPLERRGLLQVRPDAGDRRLRRLALTEAGRGLLGRAIPVWEETMAALERGIGRDPSDLAAGLEALRRAAV